MARKPQVHPYYEFYSLTGHKDKIPKFRAYKGNKTFSTKGKKLYSSPRVTKVDKFSEQAVLPIKFKFSDFIGLNFLKVILCIIIINFIGIADAQIASKHYIKTLSDSVVYYDVNINDGSITELTSVDSINVYTDDSNHIIQSVYTYDWVNKFKQLELLKPVFRYEVFPTYTLDEYNYLENISFFERFVMPYGYSYKYYDNLVYLYENDLISFVYNSDDLVYYFSKNSNYDYTSLDDKTISWANDYIKLSFVSSDFKSFTKKVANLLVFPITIGYNIAFDFGIILRFIFDW